MAVPAAGTRTHLPAVPRPGLSLLLAGTPQLCTMCLRIEVSLASLNSFDPSSTFVKCGRQGLDYSHCRGDVVFPGTPTMSRILFKLL